MTGVNYSRLVVPAEAAQFQLVSAAVVFCLLSLLRKKGEITGVNYSCLIVPAEAAQFQLVPAAVVLFVLFGFFGGLFFGFLRPFANRLVAAVDNFALLFVLYHADGHQLV